MNAKDFVANWKEERDNYLISVFSGSGLAGKKLKEMGLSHPQIEQMWQLLEATSTDILYTLLLGLDGSAAIGRGEQQAFKIYGEDGSLISNCGDLEAEAYEQFQAMPADIPALQERSLALLLESRKDWNIHEVLVVRVGKDGIARCPHCEKSFHANSRHSWDGERHLTCGGYLQLSASSNGA